MKSCKHRANFGIFFFVFRFDIKYRLRGSNIELLLARTPNGVKLAAVLSAVDESDCRLHCERHLLAAITQPKLALRCFVEFVNFGDYF